MKHVFSFVLLILILYSAITVVSWLVQTRWYIALKHPITAFKRPTKCLLCSSSKELCLNGYFSNILLLVNFNKPFYKNIQILKQLYTTMFPNIVFYGTDQSAEYDVNVLDTHNGFFAYTAVADAMTKYTNYTGYLLINDDVLLNPWTLYKYDQNKIWEGPKWPITVGNFSAFDHWYWWESRWGLKNCWKAKNESYSSYNIYKHSNKDVTYLQKNLRADDIHIMSATKDVLGGCFRGRSDVFYVPRKFSAMFTFLSVIFHKHKVFLEIAVPTMLRMITPSRHFQKMGGLYLPGRVNATPIRNASYLWAYYNENIDFIHPVKLNYADDAENVNRKVLGTRIKEKFLSYSNCK